MAGWVTHGVFDIACTLGVVDGVLVEGSLKEWTRDAAGVFMNNSG